MENQRELYRPESPGRSASGPALFPSSFRGVSAFLLTPMIDAGRGGIDFPALTNLVRRSVAGDVDSIAVLGSTGSYMYLSAAERERVVRVTVEHAGGVPVLAGIGAMATRQVLSHLRAAEVAGAAGVILAPVSYQPLTEEEVFELFALVSEASRVPIVVYDNPRTTGFTFSPELYERISRLPGIASIKIPPPPLELEAARQHIDRIRAIVPAHVTIGVSGDQAAATALAAGCDAWYSVIAGVLPEAAVDLAREALAGAPAAPAGSPLDPLLALFTELGGSLRVVAAIADEEELVGSSCLPLPVRGLPEAGRERVRELFELVRPRLNPRSHPRLS